MACQSRMPYMLTWGQGSSSWHDNDSIEEVVEFAAKAALHPSKKLNNYLFFHVSDKPREDEFKFFFKIRKMSFE